MREYRTHENITEEYFTKHPKEIEDFLAESFSEYAKNENSSTLLSQLRVIARVKGVTTLAGELGMTRQGLQKALSSKGNPRLDNINAIVQALGYHLMPQKQKHPVE